MSQHTHHTAPLTRGLLEYLLNKLDPIYCPACAAQSLINALSFVMSQTIRHVPPGGEELTRKICTEVAGHLETMAASFRRFEPTEAKRTATGTKKH